MKGNNLLNIDVHEIKAGTYFIKVIGENNNSSVCCFKRSDVC